MDILLPFEPSRCIYMALMAIYLWRVCICSTLCLMSRREEMRPSPKCYSINFSDRRIGNLSHRYSGLGGVRTTTMHNTRQAQGRTHRHAHTSLIELCAACDVRMGYGFSATRLPCVRFCWPCLAIIVLSTSTTGKYIAHTITILHALYKNADEMRPTDTFLTLQTRKSASVKLRRKFYLYSVLFGATRKRERREHTLRQRRTRTDRRIRETSSTGSGI